MIMNYKRTIQTVFCLLVLGIFESTTLPTLLRRSELNCDFNNVRFNTTLETGCNWTITPTPAGDVVPITCVGRDFYPYFTVFFGGVSPFLVSPVIYLTQHTQLFFEFYVQGAAYIHVSAVGLDGLEVELFSTKEFGPLPSDYRRHWVPARVPLCFNEETPFSLKINHTTFRTGGIEINPQPANGVDNIWLVGKIATSTTASTVDYAEAGRPKASVQQRLTDFCTDVGYPNFTASLTCNLRQKTSNFCGWTHNSSLVSATIERHGVSTNWYFSAKQDLQTDRPSESSYLRLEGPTLTLEPVHTVFSFWYAQRRCRSCSLSMEMEFADEYPSQNRQISLADTTTTATTRWLPCTISIDPAPSVFTIKMFFSVDFQHIDDSDDLGYFKLDRTWFSGEPGFDVNVSRYAAMCGRQDPPDQDPTMIGPIATAPTTTNSAGQTSPSVTNDGGLREAAIIGSSVGGVLVLIVSFLAAKFIRRKRRRRMRGNMKKRSSSGSCIPADGRRLSNLDTMELHDISSETSRDPTMSQYAKLLSVPRETLEIGDEVLGRGEFGVVYKGLAHMLPTVTKGPTVVAVKTLDRNADQEQHTYLSEEYKVMLKAGRHANIVNILGIVQQNQPYLILEYCPFGSLLTYLRNRRNGAIYSHVDEEGSLLGFSKNTMRAQWTALCHREDRTFDSENMANNMLSTNDLIKFAHQICRGMEHLVSRSIIHRDLAARNILVAENHIVKISDFGLAKHGANCYTVSNVLVPLPILWMPPDAILSREFSEKSDVWSFGILLWEIFSIGRVPFDSPDVAKFSANTFAEWLMDGHQLARPHYAPSVIYELMRSCWTLDSLERPTFSMLWNTLDRLVSDASEPSSYLPLEETCSVHDK